MDNRNRFYEDLNKPKKPRLTGMRVVMLVFGILGVLYTLISGIMIAVFRFAKKASVPTVTLNGDADIALPIVSGVFLVLGVICLAVTFILWRADRRKTRQREELKTWGRLATGTVVSVRRDYAMRVNGRNPVIAQVECQLSSGKATLTSPRLWQVEPMVGDTVDVYYDPMDERKYVIELGE